MLCLSPPVDKRPKAPWKCSFCLQNHKTGEASSKSAANVSSTDVNKTPSKSSNYQMNLKERKKQMKKQR